MKKGYYFTSCLILEKIKNHVFVNSSYEDIGLGFSIGIKEMTKITCIMLAN